MTDEYAWEGPVTEADVYKAGTLAARLTKTHNGVVFSYLENCLEGASGQHPPVATTLPLTGHPGPVTKTLT